MILAAIACVACYANAAAFVWKTATSGGKVYVGNTTDTYTGVAYIFADAGTTTQAAIFNMLVAGSDISTIALDSNSVAAGKIAAKDANTGCFTYESNTITAYFAIVDGDNFFIGPTTTQAAAEVGSAQIRFKAKASSQAAFKDASAGFSGAGWYTAVPEPTSGLLLLLGMAGLALKRKQA